MKKFTFWRNAIHTELYVVDADTESAALNQLELGNVDVFSTEFIDWATSRYELEHVEIIDPLYLMIKQHTQKETA